MLRCELVNCEAGQCRNGGTDTSRLDAARKQMDGADEQNGDGEGETGRRGYEGGNACMRAFGLGGDARITR